MSFILDALVFSAGMCLQSRSRSPPECVYNRDLDLHPNVFTIEISISTRMCLHSRSRSPPECVYNRDLDLHPNVFTIEISISIHNLFACFAAHFYFTVSVAEENNSQRIGFG
ncbi:hypothetical protein PoB_001236500 [Plakobranchus ocellatus]|uniref:Secreted protein n=1 Tax=Plakobranchus ocellatus TaxID=259542 RepID=A0AAV3YST9_9GAST|nr:hypothetical protein PoB_001236500 [Plakobranchus ocellatus]